MTTLAGAYGRTYATRAQALADWESGKDFRILPNGPYCSIRDTDALMEREENVYLMNAQKPVCVIFSVGF